MKIKYLIPLICLCICSSALANEIKQLPYANIKEGEKVCTAEGNNWSDKCKKTSADFFVRTADVFYSDKLNISFCTECSYVFVTKGRLIGYSPEYMKFYEFEPKETQVTQRELFPDEVQSLFKNFKVIKISDFSDKTNSYRFKKSHNQSIILLNDTDKNFGNYSFTTHNARFVPYTINNAIDITKSGMIQFSRFGDNTKISPWFILLAD